MNYLDFITILIGLMVPTSFVASMLIEASKKIFGEEAINKHFNKIEYFSVFISVVTAFVVYILYILFAVLGTVRLDVLDIIRLICCCLCYMVACATGSQVGYDKVIKLLKQIFHKGE